MGAIRLTSVLGLLVLSGCAGPDGAPFDLTQMPGRAFASIRQFFSPPPPPPPPAPAPKPVRIATPRPPKPKPVPTGEAFGPPVPSEVYGPASPAQETPAEEAPADTRPIHITGMQDKDVRALLGEPSIQTGPSPGETWTYRSSGCEVELYLFPDVAKGGLHVLDYRVNGPGTSVEQQQACLRGIRRGQNG
jgi:hypothetical protein